MCSFVAEHFTQQVGSARVDEGVLKSDVLAAVMRAPQT